MSDPNEALVEELARAICRSVGGNPVAGAVGEPTWVSWKNSARAILPIIARVRDEALEQAALSVDALSDDYSSSFHALAIRELKGKP